MRHGRSIAAGLLLVFLAAPLGCRKPLDLVPEEPQVEAPGSAAPAAPPKEPKPTPTPRLLPQPGSPEAQEIREDRRRAGELLEQVEALPLDPPRAETKATAESFLVQADEALAEGDLTRTALLIEKAVILLQGLLEYDR